MPEFEWKEWMEKRMDTLESNFQRHMTVMTEYVTRDDERRKTLELAAKTAAAEAAAAKEAANENSRRSNRNFSLLISLAVAILALLAFLGLTRQPGPGHSAISGDPTITATN
jgi:cbb3-type cytochrome oxidase cytochrome c subunit